MEPTLPTGKAEEPRIYISLRWTFTNEWCGSIEAPVFLEARTALMHNLQSRVSLGYQAEATLWGTLLKFTPMFLPLPSMSYFLYSLPVSIGRTFFISHLDTNPWLRSASEVNLIGEMGLQFLFFFFILFLSGFRIRALQGWVGGSSFILFSCF